MPRVTSGEISIVYSADTSYFEGLIAYAKGADLLLCEATAADDGPSNLEQGHTTGAEAGQIARRVEMGRLVLTHLGPDLTDQERNWVSAAIEYGGVDDVAQSHTIYHI